MGRNASRFSLEIVTEIATVKAFPPGRLSSNPELSDLSDLSDMTGQPQASTRAVLGIRPVEPAELDRPLSRAVGVVFAERSQDSFVVAVRFGDDGKANPPLLVSGAVTKSLTIAQHSYDSLILTSANQSPLKTKVGSQEPLHQWGIERRHPTLPQLLADRQYLITICLKFVYLIGLNPAGS